MEIQLTAKQLKITPALREYVQQKMGKTQKYFDHIVWGQAFLFVEKRSHKAEMIVHAPGQTFRAIATAADLYSAIDLASDKIDAQLKKHKERIKSRHKPKTSDTMAEAVPPVRASVVSEIFMSFPCRLTAMRNVRDEAQSLSRSAAGVALTRRLFSPYHAQS